MFNKIKSVVVPVAVIANNESSMKVSNASRVMHWHKEFPLKKYQKKHDEKGENKCMISSERSWTLY